MDSKCPITCYLPLPLSYPSLLFRTLCPKIHCAQVTSMASTTTATELIKICNFIDGKYVPPSAGKYVDNYEPSSGAVYSLVPDSDEVFLITLFLSCILPHFYIFVSVT
jgi:hypothetical protein